MAVIEDLFLIQTTSFMPDSESDDAFVLEVQSQGQRATLDFPDLPHNERERGRTDEYRFDLRDHEFDDQQIRPGDMRITTRGGDAWRPQAFWVITRNVDGEFRLLVAIPDWPPTALFSNEPGDTGAQASRPLDQP
jgi:hypothetical protein